MADPDAVTITWVDSKGTHVFAFLIESPSLEDIRKAQAAMIMPMTVPGQTETPPPTDAELYEKASSNMVNQIASQAMMIKQQNAMALIPPIKITPVVDPDKPA